MELVQAQTVASHPPEPLYRRRLIEPHQRQRRYGRLEIDTTDIIGTLEHDCNFSNLLRAIRDAGLEETLMGAGPFTVFAPEETAFESAQAGAMRWITNDTTRLQQVLTHHVVKDRLMSSNLNTEPRYGRSTAATSSSGCSGRTSASERPRSPGRILSRRTA